METIRLRKLKPEDLTQVPYRPCEAKFIDKVDAKNILAAIEDGPAYTGVLDDKVVVCAGVSIMWPGLGEAWLLTHPDIGEQKFWFYRRLKKMFTLIARVKKLHRVQSDVDCTFEESNLMMKHLGFEEESRMNSYGPNREDFFRYVLIADEGKTL